MTLICSNCESHYLIEDYDTMLHYITGYHCGMCGSTKLKEDQAIGTRHEAIGSQNPTPISDEGGNMPHKLCVMPGCKKQGVKDRLCTVHYRAKYHTAPRAQQKSYKKKCSIEGCTKQSLTQDLCYHHLTEKLGVNPYKYPKKKPSTFVEVAPNVLVPKETKVLVEQINTLQSSATTPDDRSPATTPLSMISRKETITMKVRGEEGGLLEGRIAFTYRNGSPPEFNGAGIEGTQDPLTFDDWMFLGAIASEIRRIAGEV